MANTICECGGSRHQAVSGRAGRAIARCTLANVLAGALRVAWRPHPALAQSSDRPTPGPWWTRSQSPDDATYCAVAQAWNQAIDAEEHAESHLTTDELTSVPQGAELARERHAVDALQASGHAQLAESIRTWKVVSTSSDDAVVLGTSTRLVGDAQPGESQVSGSVWVENSQTAYRLVRTDAVWRVSDQHVFEQRRHTADLTALSALTESYHRLLTDTLGAFATGDFDNLDEVLDAQALADYRQSVQAAVESGKLQHVSLDGTFAVLDASSDMALAAFSGTLTSAGIDPASGATGAPSEQPYTVIHRLERNGNDWKIVFELQSRHVPIRTAPCTLAAAASDASRRRNSWSRHAGLLSNGKGRSGLSCGDAGLLSDGTGPSGWRSRQAGLLSDGEGQIEV